MTEKGLLVGLWDAQQVPVVTRLSVPNLLWALMVHLLCDQVSKFSKSVFFFEICQASASSCCC